MHGQPNGGGASPAPALHFYVAGTDPALLAPVLACCAAHAAARRSHSAAAVPPGCCRHAISCSWPCMSRAGSAPAQREGVAAADTGLPTAQRTPRRHLRHLLPECAPSRSRRAPTPTMTVARRRSWTRAPRAPHGAARPTAAARPRTTAALTLAATGGLLRGRAV